jgi:hypothetical protein
MVSLQAPFSCLLLSLSHLCWKLSSLPYSPSPYSPVRASTEIGRKVKEDYRKSGIATWRACRQDCDARREDPLLGLQELCRSFLWSSSASPGKALLSLVEPRVEIKWEPSSSHSLCRAGWGGGAIAWGGVQQSPSGLIS